MKAFVAVAFASFSPLADACPAPRERQRRQLADPPPTSAAGRQRTRATDAKGERRICRRIATSRRLAHRLPPGLPDRRAVARPTRQAD